MTKPVLYFGDTHLEYAAAYLAGLMHLWGWEFDYVPSDLTAAENTLNAGYSLYIISDYPAANLPAGLQQRIVDAVANGAGLIMLGGWESFHGVGGDWDGTPVGNILPVEIGGDDDRVNCDHPVLIAKSASHPAVDGLPWEDRPPLIGGFNRVEAKSSATVVLEARHFRARFDKESCEFSATGTDPLLVFGRHGSGCVAAFATDVAPHWVGPLVDWGDGRVAAQAPDANEIEVGDLYARFLGQMLTAVREPTS